MNTNLSKRYLKYSIPIKSLNPFEKAFLRLRAVIFSPIYLLLAYFVGTPGLKFRWYGAIFGMKLLAKNMNIREAYGLLIFPMDSVRYFEFDFMWEAIKSKKVDSYLDVSSPRLFPLVVINKNPGLKGDLLNPAKNDLPLTKSLADGIGLSERCRFHDELINDAAFADNSFDLITCISVLEHIPDDQSAILKMWNLLRPGGKLLISIPCAAKASEEYINLDEYELLDKDENGFVFYQRYYDERLIKERITNLIGQPEKTAIYAEKRNGIYDENVTSKRNDLTYPYWREPYMMGIDYETRESIAEIPGIGVVAMEFVKSKGRNEK